jgi:hypothetical protein
MATRDISFSPVIFETPELFDLDITLQAAGYSVSASFCGSVRTKHYIHPTTLTKLIISENVNEADIIYQVA